jgi:hypothetical protein
MKAKEEIACHWLHGKKKEHECKTIFKWSYLAHSNKGRRPGLLHAAAGAAFGVQAATVRSYLAYPLLETAGASCPTSPHTSASDTAVHPTLLVSTWWPSSNTLSECYNNVDVGVFLWLTEPRDKHPRQEFAFSYPSL